MALLTAAGNVVSLIHSIDWQVLSLFGFIGMCFLWVDRQQLKGDFFYWWQEVKQASWLTYILAFLILFIALLKTSGPTEIPDEGEYFLPLVRWIEQYPVVPGTGLIHDRMGYNSAYHLTSALFSQVAFFQGGLYDLNGWLFWIIHIYFLGGVNRLLRREYTYYWSDMLMVCAGIFLFRKLLTSMDADYPTNFIGLLVLIIWIKKISEKKLKWNYDALIILVLSGFLVTVKFTALFLLLFPAWILINEMIRGNKKIIPFVLLLGAYFAVPWFFRNYFLTGFLVYPLYFIDLFQPDWKIPIEVAWANYYYVEEHAKNLVVRYSYAYEGTGPLQFWEWWPQWLIDTKKDLVGKFVLFMIPFSLVGSILSLVIKTKNQMFSRNYLLGTYLIVLIFLIFWFFKFPAIRFAWPWLLTFIVMGGLFPALQLLKIPKNVLFLGLFGLMFFSFLRGSWKSILENKEIQNHLIRPVEVNKLDRYTVNKLNGIPLTIADSVYCWGIDPPCMPFYYHQELELRTGNILDGFRMSNTNK
ncbi:MAG: membrane protein [Saprospiraceae bacterium]|nr:MAG: membrane protein [Saprospiraceae bacterium]